MWKWKSEYQMDECKSEWVDSLIVIEWQMIFGLEVGLEMERKRKDREKQWENEANFFST